MKLSTEELQEVELFAADLMSVREIAIILEKDIELFIAEYGDETSVLFKAYQKGFLTTKAANNRVVIDLAQRNSGPAQTETLRIIKRVSVANKKI